MNEQEKKISDLYFNPVLGLTTAKKIHEYLNKKIGLKIINEILNKIKNKEVVWKKDEKQRIFLPIVAPELSFQLDIMFYPPWIKKINGGYNCILSIININSKKVYWYLMKNKNKSNVIDNFKKFLIDCDNKINFLEGDDGSEFNSNEFKNLCKDNNIELKLFNKNKSPNARMIIERFNKTLRHMIKDYQDKKEWKSFYGDFHKIIESYNNSIHNATNIRPNEITNEQEKDIAALNFIDYLSKKALVETTFKIGNIVQILKIKKIFDKG